MRISLNALTGPTRFLTSMLLLVLIAATTAAQTAPIVTTDLLRMRSVTSIDVAREGQRAVFAARSIGATAMTEPQSPSAADAAETPTPDPQYKNQSHIFVIDLKDANASPRQLTFGERSDSSPRLSPDGKWVAFVRESSLKQGEPQGRPQRERESTAQIWIMPVDGGEARQLTNFKSGCNNPIWSPDGRTMLVSSSIRINDIEGTPAWPSERPKRQWKDDPAFTGVQPKADGSREQIRAWLERNSSTLNPTVINRIEFQEEMSLKGTMRFEHLFLIDSGINAAEFGPPAMIELAQARRVTSGFYDHEQPAFLPDGKSIVYTAKKPVDQHIDRVLHTSLWRINTDGSNDRMILGLDGWTLSSPKPSRDGNVLAYLGEQMDEPAFRQTQLGLATFSGETTSNHDWLTNESNFLTSVNSFHWMHGQPGLVFTTGSRGGTQMMTISPGLVQPATLVGEIDGKTVGVTSFASGGGAIVYATTSINAPAQLRVRDGFGDRMVYDLNPWVSGKTISSPVEGWITRPDGTKVQYWLMQPTNREQGKKYPLVVNMHGGPMVMWGPAEFSMWHEFQLLCSWGFGVVYCNPRGSSGYGYEFQKGNFQDWGDGPAGDVLACVDQVVLKDGAEWIDRERMVLTGGSYAGYLTAYIIANDHRFKAAVAQRGVYDFMTFYGEGNAWRLVAESMGGAPWDPRVQQVLDRNNVMNHATKIRTPLLIKHASNDLRTGVSQSELLYRTLKDLNRPVEYVRYPDAGHDLSRGGDPLQRLDRLNRMIEFFERYVTNARPAPVASSN